MLFDPQKWVMPEIPEAEPENEPWRKLLLDAANLIERKGWCRNDLQSHGRYCTVGALLKVSGTSIRDYNEGGSAPDLVGKAEAKIMAHLGYDNYDCVPDWNDKQKRGKVVIETLRKIATS